MSTPGDWQDAALRTMSEEYMAAQRDLTEWRAPPRAAVLRQLARADRRAEECASPSQRIACHRGCSHCCHVPVMAPANEVLSLAEAMLQRNDRTWRANVLARLQANAASAEQDAGLGGKVLRCALLAENGDCSAHGDRPSECRRRHSTEVRDCAAAARTPIAWHRKVRGSPARIAVDMAQHLGYRKALAEAGMDTTLYELNSALLEALGDLAACRARYERGERVFLAAATQSDFPG